VWSGGLQPAVAVLIALILLITIYGIATARETCGDLLYFWGPKAQAFHTAGKVDVDFLGWEHHYLMHPDYPPLLPLVYAWASTVAHRFSWWGALFTMPLLLLLTAFGLRGFAREQLGAERAGWFAMLMTALLAYGYAVGMVAGAADPMLIFFEVLALAALTFGDDDGGLKAAAPQSTWSGGLQPAGAWKGLRRAGTWSGGLQPAGARKELQPTGAHLVAAIALGGAAWTKIEGAAFAAIVLVAYALARRRFRPLLVLALPPAILLGSWLAFIRHYHLVDQYGRAGQKIHLELVGRVIAKTAASVKYDAWYLPWLAVLAPLACGRRWRRAALPLLTAAGTMASAVYFYLHNPDPWWWIESSAERVFLTPLACLAVAAAAASE
jgi:hypothetical protein